MKRQIVLLCGLPLTGKTTLGKELEARLKIPFVDIDVIRQALFEQPQEEMDQELDQFQMMISYKALFWVTDFLAKLDYTFIIAATFSRDWHHQKVIEISKRNNTPVRPIYLFASDEEIMKRISQREIKKDSFSTCRTPEHYEKDKGRHKLIPLSPRLNLDTAQPIEECLEKIMSFVKV